MKTFLKLFSLKYVLPTLLVIAVGMIMVRLGFWQLDRLDQRRQANEPLIKWVNADLLTLNHPDAVAALLADEYLMEYRLVEVTGTYDFENQVVLLNQHYGVRIGVSFITPLVIQETGQVVWVARGWIPQEDKNHENWGKYDEQGLVTVTGRVRLSKEKADFGNLTNPTPGPEDERIETWNVVNVTRIGEQADLDFVHGIYIQQLPEADQYELPLRLETEIEITEGSHFGYAVQWFTFALILYIGFPYYVNHLESASMGIVKNEG